MARKPLFKLIDQTWTYSGTDLIEAREAAGLTQEELAKRCGWIQQYISQLESPNKHTINKQTKDILENALHRSSHSG